MVILYFRFRIYANDFFFAALILFFLTSVIVFLFNAMVDLKAKLFQFLIITFFKNIVIRSICRIVVCLEKKYFFFGKKKE